MIRPLLHNTTYIPHFTRLLLLYLHIITITPSTPSTSSTPTSSTFLMPTLLTPTPSTPSTSIPSTLTPSMPTFSTLTPLSPTCLTLSTSIEQFYKAVYALLFHFKRDQSSNTTDIITFFKITRFVGVDYLQSFTIFNSKHNLQSAVVYKLRGFLSSCAWNSSESQILTLLYYASYGKITNNDKLVFFANDL